ncbi:MAG: YggS family pyridoxal phosphate-dependent enzyme [Wenzhouxiangella sp.]|nr:MAG: YggS family pyridoxal phosphate-dependent enzyme [Wenzhouxiangella sp.]
MTNKNTADKNTADRLRRIQARIQAACQRCGRDPGSVRLLAVSKGQPLAALEALAELGQPAFGESYVDEALSKITALSGRALDWHFIGPVQSNKTRAIAEHFDWVQSIDRAKIVRRLADQRPDNLPPLNVLVQVNLDDERQKAGCPPDQVPALAETIVQSSQLRLRGLMAIPAPRQKTSEQVAVFARLHRLFTSLQDDHESVDTLSAGMSGDLEAAIMAGSTLVRVGTDLFGPRPG